MRGKITDPTVKSITSTMWKVFNRDSFCQDLKCKYTSLKNITSKRGAISYLTGLPEETVRKILSATEEVSAEGKENVAEVVDQGIPNDARIDATITSRCIVSPSEYG